MLAELRSESSHSRRCFTRIVFDLKVSRSLGPSARLHSVIRQNVLVLTGDPTRISQNVRVGCSPSSRDSIDTLASKPVHAFSEEVRREVDEGFGPGSEICLTLFKLENSPVEIFCFGLLHFRCWRVNQEEKCLEVRRMNKEGEAIEKGNEFLKSYCS